MDILQKIPYFGAFAGFFFRPHVKHLFGFFVVFFFNLTAAEKSEKGNYYYIGTLFIFRNLLFIYFIIIKHRFGLFNFLFILKAAKKSEKRKLSLYLIYFLWIYFLFIL